MKKKPPLRDLQWLIRLRKSNSWLGGFFFIAGIIGFGYLFISFFTT